MSLKYVHPPRQTHMTSIRSIFCVSFCQVRLERGIHACSCWRYKCHWRAIDKWGDDSKPALNLLCERSASTTTSTASCATATTSTTLATSTTSSVVVYALCHSCKRLLPHVLDWGNMKLRVRGRGVCRKHHCRHLLLDSQLIGCQLVDCRGYLRQDISHSTICGSKGADHRECRCLGGCCCIIIGCVCILALAPQHVEHIIAPPRCIPLLSCCRTQCQGLEASGVRLMDEYFQPRVRLFGVCFHVSNSFNGSTCACIKMHTTVLMICIWVYGSPARVAISWHCLIL
jgi:hypothetical protein